MKQKTALFLYVSIVAHEDESRLYFGSVLIPNIDRKITQCDLVNMIILDGVDFDKRIEEMVSQRLGIMLNQSDFVITDSESAKDIQEHFGKYLSEPNFIKFYADGFADIDFLHQDSVIDKYMYSRRETRIYGKFPDIMALIVATCRILGKKQISANFEAYDVFVEGKQKFLDFIAERCGG